MIEINKKEDITQEYLHECFVYDCGRLYWRNRPEEHFLTKKGFNVFNSKYAGKEAGSLTNKSKRWTVEICNFMFVRSRLVWCFHNGDFPLMIDHINRNPWDDRIENLRIATQSQNMSNMSLPAHNTSGFKGVSTKRNKWRANIQVENKQISLGVFATPEEAHDAYMEAARKYFGEFATDGINTERSETISG